MPSTLQIGRSLKSKFVLHIRHPERLYAMPTTMLFIWGCWECGEGLTCFTHNSSSPFHTQFHENSPPNEQNCIMKKNNSSKTTFKDNTCFQKNTTQTHLTRKNVAGLITFEISFETETRWLPLPSYTTDLLQPIRCRLHPPTERKPNPNHHCQQNSGGLRFICWVVSTNRNSVK